MITLIIFIAVLAVLVLVHEFGHFVIAKRAGMKVEEFGFGFPPRIWGIKKGETVYSINAIPFGGFVKIFGEDGGDKNNPNSFASKPFWPRFKVLAAGVTMNFLLAVVLLMIGNFLGLRIGLDDQNISAGISDVQVQISQVAKDSPAQEAGLRPLDVVKGYKLPDGTVINVFTSTDVQNFVKQYAGENVKIAIMRGDEYFENNIELRKNPPAGQGAMGIALATTGIVRYPWYEAIWRGAYNAVILTINIIFGFYMIFKQLLFTGSAGVEIGGPIFIATQTGQAARIGINYLIQFVALISVNLAVLNFLPIPALDGGRALLLIIEKLRKKALDVKLENMINSVGLSLLIMLMIYATIKDISRFL